MFVNADENDYIFFKALGDKTRYKIVSALAKKERCACELPKLVGRAQPTVSLQLKYLKKAGILSNRKEGKQIIYNIRDKRIRRLLKKSA
jgi:DNA-binding transcriptional ArsR family regulator